MRLRRRLALVSALAVLALAARWGSMSAQVPPGGAPPGGAFPTVPPGGFPPGAFPGPFPPGGFTPPTGFTPPAGSLPFGGATPPAPPTFTPPAGFTPPAAFTPSAGFATPPAGFTPPAGSLPFGGATPPAPFVPPSGVPSGAFPPATSIGPSFFGPGIPPGAAIATPPAGFPLPPGVEDFMKLMAGPQGGPPSSAALQSIFESLRGAGAPPGAPEASPHGNPWEAFAASLSSPDISRVNIIPPTFDPSRPPTEAELARARAAGDEAQRAATQVFNQAYGAAAAKTPGTPANLMLTALLGSVPATNAALSSMLFVPASAGTSKTGFFEGDSQTPGAPARPPEPGLSRLYPTTCPIHTALPAALGGAVR